MPSPRRFPPPWTVEELDACFVVIDSAEQKLAYVYFEEEPGRRSPRAPDTPGRPALRSLSAAFNYYCGGEGSRPTWRSCRCSSQLSTTKPELRRRQWHTNNRLHLASLIFRAVVNLVRQHTAQTAA